MIEEHMMYKINMGEHEEFFLEILELMKSIINLGFTHEFDFSPTNFGFDKNGKLKALDY